MSASKGRKGHCSRSRDESASLAGLGGQYSQIVLLGVMSERAVADVKQLGCTSPNAFGLTQSCLQITALSFRDLFLEVNAVCREFGQWASRRTTKDCAGVASN